MRLAKGKETYPRKRGQTNTHPIWIQRNPSRDTFINGLIMLCVGWVVSCGRYLLMHDSILG
jgi:hypothetical protein